jgi:hypothetical protein
MNEQSNQAVVGTDCTSYFPFSRQKKTLLQNPQELKVAKCFDQEVWCIDMLLLDCDPRGLG